MILKEIPTEEKIELTLGKIKGAPERQGEGFCNNRKMSTHLSVKIMDF